MTDKYRAKVRLLMVAGLKPVADGGFGGQLAAATALVNSRFADAVDIVPLSSTMNSVPPPALPVRGAAAFRRLLEFVARLRSVQCVLVFSADGLSLAEKGLMCIIARAAGRGVVVRFSSGALPGQCERSPLVSRWLRLVLSSAHVVVSQGPYWTRFFETFSEAAGKVVEIRNGITLPQGGGSTGKGFNAGPRIGFVGWMQREKGIFEALDAFEEIRHVHPSAHIVFAGRGADLAEFRESVRTRGLEGYVWTPGWLSRDEIFPFLRSMDVFVLPSHFEGLPNAVLEAMACGLPVVATRVGSLPDVIVDGESGFLVDVGDTRTLAARVSELLSQPEAAREMGARAREAALQFDIERIWPLFKDATRRAYAQTKFAS